MKKKHVKTWDYFQVGLPLEMSHGSRRVMFVYIFGVISGSLATSVFDHTVFLAGASGGIYALVTGDFFMNGSKMTGTRSFQTLNQVIMTPSSLACRSLKNAKKPLTSLRNIIHLIHLHS